MEAVSEDDGDEEGDEDEVAVLVRYLWNNLPIEDPCCPGGQPQVGQAVPRPLSALLSIPTTPRATGPRRPRVGWTCNAGRGKEEDAIQFLYLSTHTTPARHDCHVAAGA